MSFGCKVVAKQTSFWLVKLWSQRILILIIEIPVIVSLFAKKDHFYTSTLVLSQKYPKPDIGNAHFSSSGLKGALKDI